MEARKFWFLRITLVFLCHRPHTVPYHLNTLSERRRAYVLIVQSVITYDFDHLLGGPIAYFQPASIDPMPADASTTASFGRCNNPIKMRQKKLLREEQADASSVRKEFLQLPQSSRPPLFGRSRKVSNASAPYVKESEIEETDHELHPRSMPRLESALPSQQAATHAEEDRCAYLISLFIKRNSWEMAFQANYRQFGKR
jgi:hypothetical protein